MSDNLTRDSRIKISVTQTSATIYLSGLTSVNYSRTAYFQISGFSQKTATISANASSTSSVTFSGMSAGTSYTVNVSIYKGSFEGTPTVLSNTFTTEAYVDNVRPTVSADSVNYSGADNSVTVKAHGSDNYSFDHFVIKKSYANSTTVGNKEYANRGDSSVTQEGSTFYMSKKIYSDGNGLSFVAGKTYRFTVLTSDGVNFSYESTVSLTIPVSRPQNWQWTSGEINAFDNKGNISLLTSTRWNAFVDRVQDFVKYKLNSTTDTSLSGAKITSDKTLYATKFNIVKNKIGGYVSTGISDVKKGDIVYGRYFKKLSECLNKF